jgi:hypothetical protein
MKLRHKIQLWWWTRARPSRLQRLHNQGDPTGEVRAIADQIIAELRKEEGI